MKLCFDMQTSYCLKHIWNSHIDSTKITRVLLHKKCTNLVYAKVSDVSKTEKVDSEEMTTKVKRFSTSNREQSQLQIVFQRIEIHFWLSKSKSKSTFQISTKIIWALFDCCVDDIVNYEFARKSLNSGLLQLQNFSTMHYIPAPIE